MEPLSTFTVDSISVRIRSTHKFKILESKPHLAAASSASYQGWARSLIYSASISTNRTFSSRGISPNGLDRGETLPKFRLLEDESSVVSTGRKDGLVAIYMIFAVEDLFLTAMTGTGP